MEELTLAGPAGALSTLEKLPAGAPRGIARAAGSEKWRSRLRDAAEGAALMEA